MNNEKDTKYIQIAALTGLVFFFGLRGFVLTDWLVYYPLFEKMPTIWDGGSISDFNTNFTEQYGTDVSIGKTGTEMGFIYFTVLFKSIIPNYFAWVFFNTLIDILILSIFIKRHSKYFVLGLILFFIFDGIVLEINLMRNIKAILLFMISIKYLHERRLIPYLLLNILGFCFHSSALIFLPLYFFLHKEWSIKIIWSIFIVGILILLFRVTYLAPVLTFIGNIVGGRISVLIQLYLMSDLYGSSYGLFHFGYIERIITFLILMIYQKRLKEQDPYNNIFLNTFVIYFIIYFYFSEIRVIIERLPLLFVFTYWVLFSNIFNLVNGRINKAVFIVILCLYSSLKLIKANNNELAKYDNVLFGIESYDKRNETFVNNADEIMNNE